jgi:hypothetical protein
MFGEWIAGHGSAGLTLLNAQRRPASGHKKTRRYVTTGGRVMGVVKRLNVANVFLDQF